MLSCNATSFKIFWISTVLWPQMNFVEENIVNGNKNDWFQESLSFVFLMHCIKFNCYIFLTSSYYLQEFAIFQRGKKKKC